MKKIVFLFAIVLLSACGNRISEEDKESMCLNARLQLEKLYQAEGITPFAMSCQVKDMKLENDTVARGRIVVEFEDWSKKPSPKVNIQAMVKFVKLHNIAWRLRPRSVDVITSYTLLGTEMTTEDSTYILKSFMNETDYE